MNRREYAIALQYVRVNYPNLYRCAAYVALLPAEVFPVGQLGQCDVYCNVSVSAACAHVGEFVDTLVHELTHAHQNRRHATLTPLEREEEAYAAGIHAKMIWERNAAPWRQS